VWSCGNVFYPDCYGNNSYIDAKRVCSGKGRCVDYNNCSCNAGYNGTQCEISPPPPPFVPPPPPPPISCFNLTGNAACNSPKGTCIGKDICTCTIGFSGNQCQLTTNQAMSSAISFIILHVIIGLYVLY
jgi:hypothetical protein